jgi:hypothetical protein
MLAPSSHEEEVVMSTKSLTVQQKKSIFLALVSAQDAVQGIGASAVVESRKSIAQQYEITPELVAKIEAEGVEKEWPPLDAA